MTNSKKNEIFKTANYQYFFSKILGIGSKVYRINAKGMAIWLNPYGFRLSERRPLYSKKGQKYTA